jgi:Leucine-rich repeat (LRR) protein
MQNLSNKPNLQMDMQEWLEYTDMFSLKYSKNDVLNLEEINSKIGFKNKVEYIPEDVKLCSKLWRIWLDNNLLVELPPEIGELSNLEQLKLGYNEIRVLPKELGFLKQLKWLHLNNNNIQELPDEICSLTNLEQLDLRNNNVVFTDQQIQWLKLLNNNECEIYLDDELFYELHDRFDNIDTSTYEEINTYQNPNTPSDNLDEYNETINLYYDLLEANVDDNFKTIKENYKRLSKEYHSDILQSKSLPQDILLFAEERMKYLNIAIEAIEKHLNEKYKNS